MLTNVNKSVDTIFVLIRAQDENQFFRAKEVSFTDVHSREMQI